MKKRQFLYFNKSANSTFSTFNFHPMMIATLAMSWSAKRSFHFIMVYCGLILVTIVKYIPRTTGMLSEPSEGMGTQLALIVIPEHQPREWVGSLLLSFAGFGRGYKFCYGSLRLLYETSQKVLHFIMERSPFYLCSPPVLWINSQI